MSQGYRPTGAFGQFLMDLGGECPFFALGFIAFLVIDVLFQLGVLR